MLTVKLSITLGSRLAKKYDANARKLIKSALDKWIAADAARGIKTLHVELDDPAAMKPFGVAAVSKSAKAPSVKRALDALVARLAPDYVVLVGAADVLPTFSVPNPSFNVQGDDDELVPTDNPYASSKPYSVKRRADYLIPDRVVGRIPDLPSSSDPSWLVDALTAAGQAQPAPASRYAGGLLVCCDSWKASGRECARTLGRDPQDLLICPPAGAASSDLRKRHAELLHMIKCHGSPIDSRFYGQKGSQYPDALTSPSLVGRTKPSAVVGAMCCYGASLFDPADPAAANPGEPPIPSVYLKQGAHGFFGSTTVAWVGDKSMLCADWVVTAFLRGTMRGASLGRAALEAKQDYVQWIQKEGFDLETTDEKTLLQFLLLGDPSIHPVQAATPASPVLHAQPVSALALRSPQRAAPAVRSALTMERKQRREARHRLGQALRTAMPQVLAARRAEPPAAVRALAKACLKGFDAQFSFALAKPTVQRLQHAVAQPELVRAAARSFAARGGPVVATPSLTRETRHYYWSARRKVGRVKDIRMVSVQTDVAGVPLRTRVVCSS
jgi:hypothetical protein